jgi:hypothetical protein
MVWEIEMEGKCREIEELKRKVSALEKLRDKCTLTNDIKISLIKYIESNEKFKDELEEKIEEGIKKQNTNKKNWWECTKCPVFIILYILLGWFVLSSIVDEIKEYKKIDTIAKTTKMTSDAK